MAKIANVQLPVRQNGQLPVQTAKDVKGADDFVNLLQQKTETAKQPDKTDATGSKEQPDTKPALKEPTEPTEQTELKEEGPDNLLDQAALEQLAVQMSVVSSSWQDQQSLYRQRCQQYQRSLWQMSWKPLQNQFSHQQYQRVKEDYKRQQSRISRNLYHR